MELVHLPIMTKKNVKILNFYLIISLFVGAVFLGCSAGSGGGGGGGETVETPVISPGAGDMEKDTGEITIT